MGFFDAIFPELQQEAIDPKTGKPLKLTKRPASEAAQSLTTGSPQAAGPSTVGGGFENPVIEDRAPEEPGEPAYRVGGPGGPGMPTTPAAATQLSEQDASRTRLLELQKFIIQKWDNNVPLLNRMAISAAKKTGVTNAAGEKIQKVDFGEFKDYLYSLDPETFFAREAKHLLGQEKAKYKGPENLLVGTPDEEMVKAGQEAQTLMQKLKVGVTGEPQTNVPSPAQEEPPITGLGGYMKTASGAHMRDVAQAPVTTFMKGLGIGKEALTERVHKAMQAVGIPIDQWESKVNTQAGILRVTSALDPQGAFAQLVKDSLDRARAEDAAGQQQVQQGEARIAETERAITGKEYQLRALYGSLGQSPFMQTWPGIILYVLVGLLTQNPAFAARLIGGVTNRNSVNAEIKGIQFDLRRLESRLARREQDQIEFKREAARRLQRREDHALDQLISLSKMKINHDLIIERNAKKGNPETDLMRKLSRDFQRSLGMASKFSGEMQNEFAEKEVRGAARENFNKYMERANALDKQIIQIGGDVLEEETDE